MKKQPFFKVMRDPDKPGGIILRECEGYIHELQDHKGYKFKVALYYGEGTWMATHYNTGLECTPYKVTFGGFYKKHKWKREELIEKLKELDFQRLEKNQLTILDRLATMKFTK